MLIKYLWDLNLDEIPLGWEATYKTALEQYPNGTTAEMILQDNDFELFAEEYEYNPVECRNIIYNSFNEYKAKAKNLLESKDEYDLKTLVNELIKIDVILYNLLKYWLYEDDYYFENSSFQPKDYSNQDKIFSLSDYFDKELCLDEYEKYRFLTL